MALALLPVLLLNIAQAGDCVPIPGLEDTCGEPPPPACPCFSEAELDGWFSVSDSYAYYWSNRPSGDNDYWSIRQESWEFECGGSPTEWSAPHYGVDVYRECGQTDGGTCEIWTDTWLAAPVHAWAGDGTSTSLALDEDEFQACQGLIDDHVSDEGLWFASW
jgi:hypothetical protein